MCRKSIEQVRRHKYVLVIAYLHVIDFSISAKTVKTSTNTNLRGTHRVNVHILFYYKF